MFKYNNNPPPYDWNWSNKSKNIFVRNILVYDDVVFEHLTSVPEVPAAGSGVTSTGLQRNSVHRRSLQKLFSRSSSQQPESSNNKNDPSKVKNIFIETSFEQR